MQRNEQNMGVRRAAAYIRVSTPKEEQENSMEVQRAYFEEYLNSHAGWSNAGIYADYGASGTTFRNREGLQALLLDCKKGRVDRIICKSLSRFSRNALEFISTLQVLRDCGVTAFFEKENLDTGIAVNDVVVTTLAAIAEEESVSVSRNISLANRKRCEAGEVRNEKIYGYCWADSSTVLASGYRYRNVEIVPEEAEMVRKIYEWAAQGVHYSEIARRLNAHGVTPPLQKNSAVPCPGWRQHHITEIVTSARYCGCVLTQKTYVSDPLKHKARKNYGELDRHCIHGHHPAIVTKELFELVQVIRQQNGERYGSRKYRKRQYRDISGVLICPLCGRRLHRRGGRQVPCWFCPYECQTEMEERTAFALLKKALLQRFGGGEDFRRNLLRMYDGIDHLCSQRTQVSHELMAVKSRIAALKHNIAVLKQKGRDPLSQSAVTLLSESLLSLRTRLRQENKTLAALQKKAEECSHLSGRALALYDIEQEIVKALDSQNGFDNSLETILHCHIRGIIAKAVVHSDRELTVHWLDNSTTAVSGGQDNE